MEKEALLIYSSGDCLTQMHLAMISTALIHSFGWIAQLSAILPGCCILRLCRVRMAALRFPFEISAILSLSTLETWTDSFC